MDIISLGEFLAKYLIASIFILILLMLVIIYLFARNTPEYKFYIKNSKYKHKIKKLNKFNCKYNTLIQRCFKNLKKKKYKKVDKILNKINKIRDKIEKLNEGDKK